MNRTKPKLVSIHGGHSGQFCYHAEDELEAIVKEYMAQGFVWVGITEHMPPAHDDYRYPDEVAAGETAASLYARFEKYVATVRHLQSRYQDQITIYLGMETEMYPGALEWAAGIEDTLKLDYLVGSIHHVDGIPFDMASEPYASARRALGGWEALYCRYFDLQYRMLQTLRPRVVGHFDLIRIYDPDYPVHLALPTVQTCIVRNLHLIKDQGAILDFNLRALTKGAPEPYISRPILMLAREMEIPVVPGDDSHGVSSVGNQMSKGLQILRDLGFSTNWPRPVSAPGVAHPQSATSD